MHHKRYLPNLRCSSTMSSILIAYRLSSNNAAHFLLLLGFTVLILLALFMLPPLFVPTQLMFLALFSEWGKVEESITFLEFSVRSSSPLWRDRLPLQPFVIIQVMPQKALEMWGCSEKLKYFVFRRNIFRLIGYIRANIYLLTQYSI